MAAFDNNNFKKCTDGHLFIRSVESKEKTPALNKCPGVGPGRRIKTGQSGGQYQEVSFTLTVLKNNHMKRFQHREILEKCKLKHSEVSPTLVRMAFAKKSTNNKCWRGCGEKGTLLH